MTQLEKVIIFRYTFFVIHGGSKLTFQILRLVLFRAAKTLFMQFEAVSKYPVVTIFKNGLKKVHSRSVFTRQSLIQCAVVDEPMLWF